MIKNKTWKTLQLITGVAALSSILLLSACGTSNSQSSSSTDSVAASPSSASKIKIVAAEDFYGEVAKAVGGDRVEVTSIIDNPNTDPHDYEPTPEVARRVSQAQLIVYDGVGYDEWMDKLISADSSSKSKLITKVADDVLDKQEGDNEHVWYNPETMPKLAKKLAADLSKVDPSNKQTYHKNAQAFIDSLAPLQEKVQKLHQPSGEMIDVSEPVFDYMAKALNLRVNDEKFALAIDEGTDPSAADVAKLQSDIKDKKINMFVYNIQNTGPTVDNLVKLAKSSGVPVVKVTETEPKGKDYLEWMDDQLDQVAKALGEQ
ncbi:zinc ABC transporter substrate-binding protein [Pullulanibacillus sp. KACC 23026]|uniref:metal ABC transporter solute-binding protein, Zn/Mn family n=1 Tax=Pullulanibacillus sp. KACC 23026 TaxID=3028315 RepID=UPI0023B1C8C2|nr:zinc ABC transporter substrate-binding protein [Pullulanibacillus sp. KACC 23026]WEG13671.1 zinc ABC transporter substrate-binding protein [Pullulanibacillus sp. KACC 23026]